MPLCMDYNHRHNPSHYITASTINKSRSTQISQEMMNLYVSNDKPLTLSNLQKASITGSLILGAYAIYYNKITKQARNGLDSTLRPKSVYNQNFMEIATNTITDSRKIRSRVSSTYKYLTSSLCISLCSSYVFWKIGYTNYLQTVWMNNGNSMIFNSWITCQILLMSLTKYTNYRKQSILKHIFWSLKCMNLGGMMSMFLYAQKNGMSNDGDYYIKCESMITMFSILSTLSIFGISIDDKYMLRVNSISFLSIFVGLINGLSLSQFFCPIQNAQVSDNQKITISLGVFGGLFTHYCAKKVFDDACDCASQYLNKNDCEYDPINKQMSVLVPLVMLPVFWKLYDKYML